MGYGVHVQALSVQAFFVPVRACRCEILYCTYYLGRVAIGLEERGLFLLLPHVNRSSRVLGPFPEHVPGIRSRYDLYMVYPRPIIVVCRPSTKSCCGYVFPTIIINQDIIDAIARDTLQHEGIFLTNHHDTTPYQLFAINTSILPGRLVAGLSHQNNAGTHPAG